MVSVIMIAYNAADFITESITSILGQTYSNIELIVVDDGSTDTTVQIIKSFKDPRIQFYENPHTGITSKMKNFAIGKSSGEYVAFLDADDMWVKEKLELQLHALENNSEAGFSISDAETFNNHETLFVRTYKKKHLTEVISIFNLLVTNAMIVYPSTILLRKQCLKKIKGFDESMMCGDHQFIMNLSFHYKTAIVYEPLLKRRIHHNNHSKSFFAENYNEYVRTFIGLYQQNFIDRKILNNAGSHAYYNLGMRYLQNSEIKLARSNFKKALSYKLLFPQCMKQLIKSYF